MPSASREIQRERPVGDIALNAIIGTATGLIARSPSATSVPPTLPIAPWTRLSTQYVRHNRPNRSITGGFAYSCQLVMMLTQELATGTSLFPNNVSYLVAVMIFTNTMGQS